MGDDVVFHCVQVYCARIEARMACLRACLAKMRAVFLYSAGVGEPMNEAIL